MELELDFSDQDVEFADRTELFDLLQSLDDHISRLINSFSEGNAIREGIPVAILGAPNVGKSTLLNALLGDDRAIVSDVQGTTRDTVEDTVTIGGRLFRFIDTAGLRHTDDTVERMGIERSLRAAERARIVLLVAEPGVPYPDFSPRADQQVIRILNKSEMICMRSCWRLWATAIRPPSFPMRAIRRLFPLRSMICAAPQRLYIKASPPTLPARTCAYACSIWAKSRAAPSLPTRRSTTFSVTSASESSFCVGKSFNCSSYNSAQPKSPSVHRCPQGLRPDGLFHAGLRLV